MSIRTYTDIVMLKNKIQYVYNDKIRIEFDGDFMYLNGNSMPTGIAPSGTVLTALEVCLLIRDDTMTGINL